ncbi:MAG: recombinase family protein [Coriobacteriia bacterium]|nr:recombinase family protein [Coriobacteriia bacterium]
MSKNQNTAALYMRLSHDDELQGESNSITNQRKLLRKVATDLGFSRTAEYIDDGISGTTFNRPGFLRMEQDIVERKLSTVIVKDMSRLGRDYLKVGYYTDSFFPEYDVRFVAVNDNVDSDNGDNDFVPFRNLLNEWYAKDSSLKIRASFKVRGMSGEPLGFPPYGYMVDPDNKKHWIIDYEAASVVRRIFDMTLAGVGTNQIADALCFDGVLTPLNYWASKGIRRPNRPTKDGDCNWIHSTVVKILSTREYCGDLVNFKTYSKSYKHKARRKSDPKDLVIFEDVHEPIISREDWERVQKMRANRRQRKPTNKRNIFSGMLRCADCGATLRFQAKQENPDNTYYLCPNNNNTRRTCSSTHSVRADFLEKVVLQDIRRITRDAMIDERDFAQRLHDLVVQDSEQTQTVRKQRSGALRRRVTELDALFKRIYEDRALGALGDERYAKLASDYEAEQVEVEAKLDEINREIESHQTKTASVDEFVKIIRKHSQIRKLTLALVREFIDEIHIHQATRKDGRITQQIDIYYNCVGMIPLSQRSENNVKPVEQTIRKGVAISYTPLAA